MGTKLVVFVLLSVIINFPASLLCLVDTLALAMELFCLETFCVTELKLTSLIVTVEVGTSAPHVPQEMKPVSTVQGVSIHVSFRSLAI